MFTDHLSSAIFTKTSQPIVLADRSTSAIFTVFLGAIVLADGAYLEDAGERSPAQRACIVAQRGAHLVDGLVRALRAAEGGLVFDGLGANEAGCVVTQDWLAPLTHSVPIPIHATTIVAEKSLAHGAVHDIIGAVAIVTAHERI